MNFEVSFFIFEAELVFIQLKKAFTKALILYYFNLEHHIQIEINILDYAIGKIQSQLTFKTGLIS